MKMMIYFQRGKAKKQMKFLLSRRVMVQPWGALTFRKYVAEKSQ